mmetsp:Transcript_20465/g.62301  ORF Transcript_20465/g.62301 Transcript_20465/m.62301 type:complete len:1315 (-) Transcript_20465:278-4222(-)
MAVSESKTHDYEQAPQKDDAANAAGKEADKTKKEEEQEGAATIAEMFMLADSTDYFLMTIGTIAAAANGISQPLMVVLLGDAFESLSGEDLTETAARVSILFCILAAISQVAAAVQFGAWQASGRRQSQKLREAWFRAVVRQDIGWFDVNNPGEMPSRIASSILTFEEGVSKKVAEGIQFLLTFVAGLAIAFFYNAYVSLVVVGLMPLLAMTGGWLIVVNTETEEATQTAYAKAGAVAYEVIASLRTVLSFNGTQLMRARYAEQTAYAEKVGISRALKVGIANGAMLAGFVVMYLVITFFGGWMIWTLVEEDGCDPSNSVDNGGDCELAGVTSNGTSIFVAMLSVAFGGQALGQIATSATAFTAAKKAIKAGVDVINRTPPIDNQSDEGLKPKGVTGRITVEEVEFHYPARPDIEVCQGYSLVLEPGTTTALVGESGSGKSTIVGLIQRFYDPKAGRIALDGNNLKDLNVKWLREQMALVGQEPKLFSGTIAENIAQGNHGKTVTQRQIEDAAGLANAHEFIAKLPHGYDTQVGHGGSQLSGGQKQRIAIARALISDPSILLLDEATSALDNKSERVVQDALDRLLTLKKRTTVVIAHRLSTVRNADNIAVVKKGRIVEQGTHDELMQSEAGHYRSLVEHQQREEDEQRGSVAEGAEKDRAFPAGSVNISSAEPEDAMEDVPLKGEAADEETGAKKEDAKGDDKDKEEEDYDVPISRVWELNKQESPYLAAGVFGAFLAGACYPGWGILFAKMIEILYTPVFPCEDAMTEEECDNYLSDKSDDIREDSIRLGLWWLVILAATMIGNGMMFWGFGVSSAKLSRRVRDIMFDALLRQEPGYFDMPENSVGAVTSRLATDATLIKSKTGEPLQQIVMVMFSIGAGIVVSLVYCWPLALVSIGTIPLMGLATYIQMAIMLGTTDKAAGESSEAGAVVGETISAVRTVASLSLEETLVTRYTSLSLGELDDLVWKAIKEGNAFGASISIQLLNNALLFWWGAWLIENMDFTFDDFLVSMFAMLFAVFGLGAAGQNITGAEEARKAMNNVFRLLDRTSKIDPEYEGGEKPTSCSGGVTLDNVNFTYPSRPDQQICKGYSLDIKPGITVGLVGPSGSGKSTAIQLAMRFYDPDSGAVSLDGKPLNELNYRWLHETIGFVGQEPVLFSGSVKDNIAMGAGGRALTDEEIKQAAIKANADGFISAFPEGYDTDIGNGGDRLSGGQKQRVAIARALVHNPSVLLLDEATSALDSESEKVVQEALDKLIKETGLTTIMIAHRLTTIENCDIICVVDGGRIVEQGKHAELMAMGGIYTELVNASHA